jgi:hypothetical protein
MKRFRLDSIRVVGGFVLAAALCGCGGDVQKAKIHGKVTLDGQAVPTGSISFIPADGKTPTAGGVIKDGVYTAEVPLGSVRVEIHYPKVVGKRKLYDTPDSPTTDVTQEQIPPKYNTQSQLTEDITAQRSEINFDLQSK